MPSPPQRLQFSHACIYLVGPNQENHPMNWALKKTFRSRRILGCEEKIGGDSWHIFSLSLLSWVCTLPITMCVLHVYMFMSLYGSVKVCLNICGGHTSISSISSLPQFLWQGLSLAMELTNLSRVAGQWVLGSPALCHSCTRTIELYSRVQHFTCVLGIQTQVLRLAQHTLHQQSHLDVSVLMSSLLSSFALSSIEKLNREVGDSVTVTTLRGRWHVGDICPA